MKATRTRLPGQLPPSRAAHLVAGDAHPFALTGVWAGAAAIASSEPTQRGQAPFVHPLPAVAGDAVFGGGWVGFLGYGRAAEVEAVVPPPPRARAWPDAAFAFYDHVVVADADGAWWFEALVTPERAAALAARREVLGARLLALAELTPRPARLRDVRLRPPGAAGHRAAVTECRDRIAAGELFQANLSLTLDARLEGTAADAAAQLAGALGPAHGAYLEGPWGAIAGASPELFLRRTGREVLTSPIKGTAAAGGTPLADSAKDQAEHVMIVDLMRNDLGRVCAYGSVHVSALTDARGGVGVTHLVSDVRGTLRDGVSDADLLRATFPPGSVTGAPKVQALRVIADLEAFGREAYTGALGYLSPVAGLELAVSIRTFELTGDAVRFGVGGGITAGSDPDGELAECRTKAVPLLAALGARWPDEPPPAPARRLPRALTPSRTRPDPAQGVFETIRVAAGVPQRLDAHLDRLAASAATLYGLTLDRAALRSAVTERGQDPLGHGRLRLDLDTGGAIRCAWGPAPAPSRAPVRLAPVLLPGGLGAHKWRDRRLVEALAEELGAVPLLVDGDGAVLEAAWASVWLREGDALVTPEADGRILPGVARAARLEGPAARAEPVDLDRARAADGLAVSTALRGLVPAVLVA